MHALALLCLLFGVALAAPKMQLITGSKSANLISDLKENIDKYDNKRLTTTVNGLADMILEEVRNFMVNHNMDPMQLPDIHQNFSFKPIIITYHGELDLTEGILQNSSSLYRAGDVILNFSKGILSLDIPLNFKRFMFNYDYSAKLMGLGPKGQVEGKVLNIRIFCSIEVDFNKMFVTLNTFKIDSLGEIQVKFHGHILLDIILNILSGVVTTIFKGLIKFIAEGIVKSALETIIAYINVILGIL